MVVNNKKLFALTIALVMLSLAALSFVGCGGEAEAPANGDEEFPAGSITIGSGAFSEPWILAEIAKILLEENGNLEVDHINNFQGSNVLHQSMMSGDLDLYISWTGTQFAGILEMEITEEWRDREKVYNYVKDEFDERYDIHWFPPLGFDNTYAVCVRQDFAEEHGLETVSDLREMAPDLKCATDVTFMDREGDGYYDMLEHYDMEFEEGVPMDYGLLYRAVAAGDVDAAIAYSTDGRVGALDLVILEDDRNFFPPYDGAIIARNPTLADYPQIEEVLSVMWDSFDEATMAALNAEVDVDERDYQVVARDFVEEMGWID